MFLRLYCLTSERVVCSVNRLFEQARRNVSVLFVRCNGINIIIASAYLLIGIIHTTVMLSV